LRGPDVAPVRLTGDQPISPSAGAQFARVRAYVLQSIRDIPPNLGADATDLLAGSLAQLIAAAVLVAFPNTAVIEPTAADRRDAHPHSLRRAIAFIESHPRLDLSMAEIAGAADVTARALQLAFRQHLNTTPMAYLRRIRLDRAHAELRAATPGDRISVTVIAARWGYARPSRFSADYLAAYGRHPQDTLRAVYE
jgi:transcriptional regulator GlxA family with amidase domain